MNLKEAQKRLKKLDFQIIAIKKEKEIIINSLHLCHFCYKKSDREVTECQKCHDGYGAYLG